MEHTKRVEMNPVDGSFYSVTSYDSHYKYICGFEDKWDAAMYSPPDRPGPIVRLIKWLF